MKNSLFLKATLFLSLTFSFLGAAWAQTLMIKNFNNIYSPHLEFFGDNLKMYFGGWKVAPPTQTRDTIYRANCFHPRQPCDFETSIKFDDGGVWREVPDFLKAINDPTIVKNDKVLILYFTACPKNEDCMKYPGKHNIYSSVSWATDGIYWSAPQVAVAGAWLPSVTKSASNNILLYYNVGNGGQLRVRNLGTQGSQLISDQLVVIKGKFSYINVEIR